MGEIAIVALALVVLLFSSGADRRDGLLFAVLIMVAING